jgi:hypothetical protein
MAKTEIFRHVHIAAQANFECSGGTPTDADLAAWTKLIVVAQRMFE